MTKKRTPLTVEFFHLDIMPALSDMIDEKLEDQKKSFKSDVLEFKEEVLGEIKKFREEMTVSN